MEEALYQFKTGQGGTTKLELHTKAQQNASNAVRFLTSLPVRAKTWVAHAAPLTVALDIRPLSFCNGHPGMREFKKTIFELRQNVPVIERIDPKCYSPGRTAVTSTIGEISKSLRQKFFVRIEFKSLRYGGVVSVDGVHIKVKGKYFYDFTVQYIEIGTKKTFDEPVPRTRKLTLLLVESPPVLSARNLRDALNTALLKKHEIGLDYFLKFFITIINSATVMALVVNASVSLYVHDPDETWIGCIAHFPKNLMKHVISKCRNDNILTTMGNDLRSVKKIVDDANRSERNHFSPDGYTLIQESETRFGRIAKSLNVF